MNNRPLFWAVICFALGEVICIVADKGSKISTALVVLIFGVAIISRLKLNLKKIMLYVIMFLAGIFRVLWADYLYLGDQLFGTGDYRDNYSQYEKYKVVYVDNQESEAREWADVKGIGVVDNLALGTNGYNITVKLDYIETEKQPLKGNCKVIIYSMDETISIGERVSFFGKIYDFVPSHNPGEFNRRSYYKARGIVGYAMAGDVQLSPIEELNQNKIEGIWYELKSVLYYAKSSFVKTLEKICPGECRELFMAILLGEKGGIPDEDMLLYRISGIAHIFAISGLHIGIVGGLLYKLARKAGLKFLWSAGLAMAVTILYGIMTGFSFSTIRAIVMLSLSLVGEVLGRRYDMLTSMGLALGILLVVEPYRIFDGGLILSFGAVAGVVVSRYIVKLLEGNKRFRQLQTKRYRVIYGIISSLIFSFGISLVSTPLVAYMYYQIPIYSVLLNMLVVPFMSVTVFCGFSGVVLGMFSSALGKIIIFPGVLSLKLYKLCCTVLQMLPGGILNTGRITVYEVILYYLALAFVLIGLNRKVISYIRKMLHSKTKKWIPYMSIRFAVNIVVVALTLSSVVGILCIRSKERVEKVTFLDVGQGDGILINTRSGVNMVIDVGSSSNDSLGQYVAYPAILSQHNGHIDYWFISHFDSDHTSGLEYIINSSVDMGIQIDNLVVSAVNVESQEMLIQTAEERGINIIYMKAGECMQGEDFVIKAIHPFAGFKSEDKNEQSLVLSYESSNLKILFTGDIGAETMLDMLDKKEIENDYDVLKVPHHGSKYSYSMKFLEEINSEVAVISCGIRNSYGHPHRDMVEGLYNSGNDVYRTDYQGRIMIIAD